MPLVPVLGSSAFTGLLVLVFAVLGFALVAVVAAVVLALINTVLPGGDGPTDHTKDADESADLHSGPPVG